MEVLCEHPRVLGDELVAQAAQQLIVLRSVDGATFVGSFCITVMTVTSRWIFSRVAGSEALDPPPPRL